jgi:hypothetical protein
MQQQQQQQQQVQLPSLRPDFAMDADSIKETRVPQKLPATADAASGPAAAPVHEAPGALGSVGISQQQQQQQQGQQQSGQAGGVWGLHREHVPTSAGSAPLPQEIAVTPAPAVAADRIDSLTQMLWDNRLGGGKVQHAAKGGDYEVPEVSVSSG